MWEASAGDSFKDSRRSSLTGKVKLDKKKPHCEMRARNSHQGETTCRRGCPHFRRSQARLTTERNLTHFTSCPDDFTPYHRSKIGSAIWVRLGCLRRVTAEHGGLGFVLGGSRIKIERIAEELGISSRSIGADLARLKQGGYLQVRRIPYGLIITVLKSKRGFDKKRSEENFRSEIGRNLPISP